MEKTNFCIKNSSLNMFPFLILNSCFVNPKIKRQFTRKVNYSTRGKEIKSSKHKVGTLEFKIQVIILIEKLNHEIYI